MSEFDNTPIEVPETSAPPKPSVSGNEQVMAIASIVMGVISLCAGLFVGLCAAPFSIIGLVLGYLALRDPNQKNLAIIGMALSGLSFLIVCVLMFIAGGLMILGPAIGNVFSEINQSLQTAP
jgi:hypothetical protein